MIVNTIANYFDTSFGPYLKNTGYLVFYGANRGEI